ncbi:MAG: hypothetical protein ACI97K_000256 [Glaciecola sp.]
MLGQSICVQATLVQNGRNISGEIINFTADIGALSAATKLTYTNGVAQITLDSINANIGAGALTASVGQYSGSANYEFLADPTEASVDSTISVNLFDESGDPITRFRANQEVQVQATLLNGDGSPIDSEIITF